MTPRASVVMATYNYGQFVAGAIKSVLAQTFKEFELLVVDDGSTDDTEHVVRGFLSDPRVRYERTAHVGQPRAKNAGIRRSQAALIAFLDADDYWAPTKLERQLALFRADPQLGVAYTLRHVIDAEGHLLHSKPTTLHRGWVLPAMFRDNFVCFSSSIVRRGVLDDVGLFDETLPLAIDYDLWLRIALKYRFDYVPEALVFYRTGHANLSQRGKERLVCAMNIMDRFLDERGGRSQLDAAWIRRAYAETFLHLGLAVSQQSRWEALQAYRRSARLWPTSLEVWKQIVHLALPVSLARVARVALGRPPDWRVPRRVEVMAP